MKTFLSILFLSGLFFSCNNSETGVADKKEVLYDTIPVYDLNTGDVIGDTVIIVDSKQKATPRQSDTIPVFSNGHRIGDSILSSHTFIPAK